MGKKKKEPEVRQPSAEEQRLYQSLRDNEATLVHICKREVRLRWLKKGQMAKLGRLLVESELREERRKAAAAAKHGDGQSDKSDKPATASRGEKLTDVVEDGKLACKAAAIYLLDGYWKLRLWYWLVWRWFYYVRQYGDGDLAEVLAEGKKKVPQQQFLYATMSLTGAKDTLMMMRTAEAEHILHELRMEQPSQEPKSVSGS